ncbi:threonine synthase [Legionella quateirensis]|uniref:Threonine synthase n=1 Tax=Legionella quateirensis TaxID=45072 RepID=A0A378KT18_9GAMM|nr:threonine synthase [Legionella quateirensis]KTD51031.1 threonine synthase [Legionella quateirensis]STY17723.1 threonine synthase [Legionella quateirensis]
MKNNMRSTRKKEHATIDEAILCGLARDGGLYVPEQFPKISVEEFYDYSDLIYFSSHLLSPFFANSVLKIDHEFCQDVFSFPLPLKALTDTQYVLELFHGPTLSFKDFGARFFAQCLQYLSQDKPKKVLVATSGDTGSAVASALHGRAGIEGYILFPKEKISLRQQAQITCWGDNIHALAVHGTFDQCQQLVKMACLRSKHQGQLTTANSINIARLLPQMVYYAYSSILLEKRHQKPANFIVPSGNLGNVTACYWAKVLGFPIDEILIANNANRVLSDYLITGTYKPKQSIKTLANAMDVGDPSNLERLIDLFGDFEQFKQNLNVESVLDHDIIEAIMDCYTRYHYILCPHTATSYHRLNAVDSSKIWVLAGTAHPVKFDELIEPLLNIKIPVPNQLKLMLEKKQCFNELQCNFESFYTMLNQ